MSLLARFDPSDAVTGPIMEFVVHSVLIVLLAATIGGTVLRRRAELRHSLWLGTLILLCFCPALAATLVRMGFTSRIVALPLEAPVTGAIGRGGIPNDAMDQSESVAMEMPLTAASMVAEAAATHRAVVLPRAEKDPARPQLTAAPRSKSRGGALLGGLTLLWAFGALLGCVRMAASWWRLASLRRSAEPINPVRHRQALERARLALGDATLPPVFSSSAVRGPLAIGLANCVPCTGIHRLTRRRRRRSQARGPQRWPTSAPTIVVAAESRSASEGAAARRLRSHIQRTGSWE
jgi:hypothetical protein